jgi:hypothetical protein
LVDGFREGCRGCSAVIIGEGKRDEGGEGWRGCSAVVIGEGKRDEGGEAEEFYI